METETVTAAPHMSLTVAPLSERAPEHDVRRWVDVPDAKAFEPLAGRLQARVGESMSFRFALDVDHEIHWTGAESARLKLHSSTAVARFDTPGEHVVRAEIWGLDGRLIASISAFVDVLPSPSNRHSETTVRIPTPPASL